jgi:integrase
MTPFRGTVWDNNGRWWWRVTLPGETKRRAFPLRDPQTDRVTTSRRTAESIAQRLWDEAESKHGTPAADRPQACTVGRLRTLWIEAQTRPEDAAMNTAALAELARRPADSIRPSEILALQEKMRTAPPAESRPRTAGEPCLPGRTRRRKALAVRTVNRRIRAIASVFAFGAARDLLPAEIAWGIKSIAPVRGSSPGFGVPDIIAVHRTLEHVTPTIWRMIVLQMLTGLRSGELCRITAADVTRDGGDWLLRIPRHKTKASTGEKLMVLGPRAIEVIGPLLDAKAKAPDDPLFAPGDSERERGYCRECRPAYDARSYYQAIMHAIAAAGVPHWHPHQLRHLAATAISDTLTEDHARAQLGHTTAGMTRAYIHERRRKAREVAEQLG